MAHGTAIAALVASSLRWTGPSKEPVDGDELWKLQTSNSLTDRPKR